MAFRKSLSVFTPSHVHFVSEISTSQQDENDVEVADMLKKWGEFLQKLARHVRATSQDESENQARLLLAELSSYYDFIKRQHLI